MRRSPRTLPGWAPCVLVTPVETKGECPTGKLPPDCGLTGVGWGEVGDTRCVDASNGPPSSDLGPQTSSRPHVLGLDQPLLFGALFRKNGKLTAYPSGQEHPLC